MNSIGKYFVSERKFHKDLLDKHCGHIAKPSIQNVTCNVAFIAKDSATVTIIKKYLQP